MSEDLTRERAQAWATVARKVLAALSSQPGIDLSLRREEVNVADFSDRKAYEEALHLADEAATDRRGYAEAMEPLKKLLLAGKIGPTDAKVWQIIFAVRGGKFRPKYAELQEIVCRKLGIDPATINPAPITGADAAARTPVTAPGPTVLGIPGATVASAYHGVPMPKRSNITLEDVPTHDNEGNLIGEGRRRFLCSMHRMRGGHHPNPDKEPVLDFEEGPKPKMEVS